MSGFTDGNYFNPYLTKNVVSYPLADKPNNSNVACYDLTYYQWANTYTPNAVGSTSGDAPSAYLYTQSTVERVGAGVVRYTRSYAQQPFTWYEIEQLQYTYPGLDSGVGTTNYVAFGARSAITKQKIATVEHKYVLNANVPYANVLNVFIVTLNGQPINRIGQWFYGNSVLTVPTTDPNVYVVSSDATRWKGNLWEVVTKTVTQANVYP